MRTSALGCRHSAVVHSSVVASSWEVAGSRGVSVHKNPRLPADLYVRTSAVAPPLEVGTRSPINDIAANSGPLWKASVWISDLVTGPAKFWAGPKILSEISFQWKKER